MAVHLDVYVSENLYLLLDCIEGKLLLLANGSTSNLFLVPDRRVCFRGTDEGQTWIRHAFKSPPPFDLLLLESRPDDAAAWALLLSGRYHSRRRADKLTGSNIESACSTLLLTNHQGPHLLSAPAALRLRPPGSSRGSLWLRVSSRVLLLSLRSPSSSPPPLPSSKGPLHYRMLKHSGQHPLARLAFSPPLYLWSTENSPSDRVRN